jgi:hypothetical protein
MKKQNPKQIVNKIIAQRPVKWRDLEWLQIENLKDIPEENFEKLKNSLQVNNFIQPFNVWEQRSGLYSKIWILDGRSRKKAMMELEEGGVKIPEKLPANFIQCKNRKEAAKLVLVYSSLYAKITQDGLKEFMDINKLLLKDIDQEMDLGFDLSLLSADNPDVDQLEKQKNISDIYIIIGEYRLLLERKVYLKWMSELKQKEGEDKIAILKEIKRRLRIN